VKITFSGFWTATALGTREPHEGFGHLQGWRGCVSSSSTPDQTLGDMGTINGKGRCRDHPRGSDTLEALQSIIAMSTDR